MHTGAADPVKRFRERGDGRQDGSGRDGVTAMGTQARGEESRIGLSPLRGSSLAEAAAEALYAAILDGRIGFGERLSEAAIARDLGISRGPIREAQRLLERRGLLEFEPRRGFFLRSLDRRQIEDLFSLRRLLELHAAQQAVARATDAELAALGAWRERLLALDARADLTSLPANLLVEEDLAIHRLLCRLSGNRTLIGVFETVLTEIRLALALINLGFQRPARIVESHHALVEALLARDAAAACDALAHHLDYSRGVILERLGRGEPPAP